MRDKHRFWASTVSFDGVIIGKTYAKRGNKCFSLDARALNRDIFFNGR